MTSIIDKYFPWLTDSQREQFSRLPELYADWNAKINVISRKDIENVMLHHVLHSLAIAKVIKFVPGTSILDVGTGGGFPGVPLAIMFPDVKFHLVDSIRKKTLVASEVARAVGLENVRVTHRNAIEEKEKYDFIVTRAVMRAAELVKITQKNILTSQHNALTNGIIALKGGDLEEELQESSQASAPAGKALKRAVKGAPVIWKISDYFDEEYFEEKVVVHIPL